MKVEIQLNAPDEVEAIVAIRASLGDLRRLEKQISETPGSWSHPVSSLLESLRTAIRKCEQTWNSTSTPEGQQQ